MSAFVSPPTDRLQGFDPRSETTRVDGRRVTDAVEGCTTRRTAPTPVDEGRDPLWEPKTVGDSRRKPDAEAVDGRSRSASGGETGEGESNDGTVDAGGAGHDGHFGIRAGPTGADV